MTRFLTAQEAAKLIGVSASAVTRLANTDMLRYETIGTRRIFSVQDVNDYLANANLRIAPQDHERRSKTASKFIALSFFSGAGGLDLGMERAGFSPILYCENNRECRMTIDANRPDAALLGDITRASASDVRRMAQLDNDQDIDVMFGGPPCQAFSTAGARRAFNDARGNVFLKFLDLATELRPRYLVIENVRGLLSTAYPTHPQGTPVRGGAMRIILDRLDRMGYSTSFNLYNAANFGAPQIRERVVIIAKREGERCAWLTPTHSDDSQWHLPPWVTFADAVGDIEDKPQHHTEFPPKRLKYFRMLQEGQHWNSLPKDLQRDALGKAYDLGGGKTGFYRRIAFNRPCPTLVTSPTMPATDLCHPTENRPLSVEEYKRVQGFPDDWWIAGSISDQYRQIGNAVPVMLGAAIGQAIRDDMNGAQASNQWINFPYSRYSHTSDRTWDFA